MLDLLGIVLSLMFIIMFISNGLKESKMDPVLKEAQQNGKMTVAPKLPGPKRKKQRLARKDVSENDLQIMATILSAGLVDVDPSSLQQLREFRDLRGAST